MSLPLKKTPVTACSGPEQVLHRIGAAEVTNQFADDTRLIVQQQSQPDIKLHQPVADADTAELNFSDADQLRQLGRHVIQMRDRLHAKIAEFESDQRHWVRQSELEFELIESKKKSLDQRERQIKSLELQLLQLQNDVISGQLATEKTVQQLTDCRRGDGRDGQTIATLLSLRFELNQRFEYLIKRWQNFQSKAA